MSTTPGHLYLANPTVNWDSEIGAEGALSKKSEGAQHSDGTFPAGIAEAATGTRVTGMGWGGRVGAEPRKKKLFGIKFDLLRKCIYKE